MAQPEKRENIVVVGGGPVGAATVKELSAKLDPSKYNLILITARPYYTHLPAWIRMSVTAEGKLEDRAHIPYERNFVNGNGKYLPGKVVSIQKTDEGGRVTLADGQIVDWSVLILATGCTWDGPLAIPNSKTECVDWLRQWREKVERAQDILLVGGGAVAIEYAGEIKDIWPNKKVTIVHKNDLLLNTIYPRRWRKGIMNRLRKRGVQLILDDAVEDLEPVAGAIITKGGKRLTPDLVIPCRGGRPNTEFLQSLGDKTLTEDKYVRVSATLQLFSHNRIFAGGDMIDWTGDEKQEYKSYSHASIISRNVMALLKKVQPPAHYYGMYERITIAVGKHAGASYYEKFWGLSFGDWISSMIKSKDLQVNSVRKRMGLNS